MEKVYTRMLPVAIVDPDFRQDDRIGAESRLWQKKEKMKKVSNKSFSREEKVASAVQRHVAGILAAGFSERDLASVSLVGADAKGGLQFVRLYYYVAAGADKEKIARILEAATPKIRRQLAEVMNQRFVPDIRFVYDDSLEKGKKIEELLEKLKE